MALNYEIGVEVCSSFIREKKYYLYKVYTEKKLPRDILKKS